MLPLITVYTPSPDLCILQKHAKKQYGYPHNYMMVGLNMKGMLYYECCAKYDNYSNLPIFLSEISGGDPDI